MRKNTECTGFFAVMTASPAPQQDGGEDVEEDGGDVDHAPAASVFLK